MDPTPPRTPALDASVLLKLDNQLCFALHSASRRVIRAYQSGLHALDLTYPQYLVMMVLWEWDAERPARPTLGVLGDKLDLDSGTLTPLVRRLEQKGLVLRERGQNDARELIVRVSRKGRALREKAASVPLSLLEASPLSIPEILALREQLQRLRNGLPWSSDVRPARQRSGHEA
ncbi:MAG: hypothetical protein RL385_4940 [Pseudomonadota bacterium]